MTSTRYTVIWIESQPLAHLLFYKVGRLTTEKLSSRFDISKLAMYNQNGNVPFNWVSVQQSQNNNLVQTEDEIALPPRFGNAERPIATEITSYDYYGRYHDVPTCQVQSNAAIQGLSHRPIVNDHHNLGPVPNWDTYSHHSATQQPSADVQSVEQAHNRTYNAPYHPYSIPLPQTSAWGYYNNPYSDYSHQSRHPITPPNYTQSESEVAITKAKPPNAIKACASCKASHVACDAGRPCQRCIRLGKVDTCVDATRKKRGRPKNSSKTQQQQQQQLQQQPVSSTTDSAGCSSAEATPLHTVATGDPPDQLLESSQLLVEYEPSSGEQTPPDYPNVLGNSLEQYSSSSANNERRITPLSPSAVLRSSAMEGHTSIIKQQSLPSSLAARRGSSTSPSSTPKRRHSHRSAQEASQHNIQPIMLQHHQSVQYPGAHHRHTAQTFNFQDPSLIDTHGINQIGISVSHSYPSASSTPSRAIHPLSTQLTYTESDREIEYRNMHQYR
ncbi:hypothetical protein BGW37DRAFT_524577 [Umbelopsis sp. PMI_123]|nr:hypothetical protein BGW37DRAFT_524577 [Umbelopsis sp. PMI_123]